LATASVSRVQAAALRRTVETIIAAAGSAPEEAELVAQQLVEANLAGHDSHGVHLVAYYVAAVRAGTLRPNRHVQLLRDAGAVIVLEGDRGYGQVLAGEAVDLGIARAREQGAAVVALRNSHHCGRIGHWGERCARAGLASIHLVNAPHHDPVVAPHGGRERRMLTDPVCMALPMGDDVALLDFATSAIAFGKVQVAHARGQKVPEGCLIDEHGRPTTDPADLATRKQGALLPAAGHKGYALAVMCELLAGALTGGDTIQPGHPRDGGICNNMLSIVLAPEAFGPPERMREEAEALCAWMRSSAPAPGFEEVLVPGEPEARSRALRGTDGIPIELPTLERLIAAGESVGLDAGRLRSMLGGR
jgi:hydroxycarboxylate dehydrogenase B